LRDTAILTRARRGPDARAVKTPRGKRAASRSSAVPRSADRPRWALGALAIAVVAFGIWLRSTLPPVRLFTPDEQTYATLAASFTAAGFGRYPQVVHDYCTVSDLQQLPPPTRVGYFALAVGAMKVTGQSTPVALAMLSTMSSVLILALATFAAFRWFGPGAAVVTALLLAASPIDLAIARRAWQDDVLALFGVGMLLALLARGAGASWRALVLFFALGTYALLVKETAVGLLGLGAALLALWAWREGGVRSLGGVIAGFAAAVAAAVLVLCTISGGFAPMREAFAVALRGQASNPYVIKYQSGGPMYYVTGLAILQPVGTALAAFGAIAALARPGWMLGAVAPAAGATAVESRRRVLFALVVWTAGFVIASALYPLKSIRFLSPAFAPAAMLGGIAVMAALREARARLSASGYRVVVGAAVVLLVVMAVFDLRRFLELFVRREIPDLATPWFTRPS